MKERYCIVEDTICSGYTPITDADTNEPIYYDTELEAEAEIIADGEFYDECFVVTESELGHKTIFYGN